MNTLRRHGTQGSTSLTVHRVQPGGTARSGRGVGLIGGLGAVCVLTAVVFLSGCGWTGASGADRGEAVRGGEVSGGSASVTAGGGGASGGGGGGGGSGGGARAVELEYLDLLERRPVIGADDMLSGLLMVRAGSMGRNYMARVTEARRLGIVDQAWDAPARRAMTAEDLAVAVVATLGDVRTRASALPYVQSRGWLPSDLAPASTVSGAQFLSLLGNLSDELARRGRGGSSMMRTGPGVEADPFDQLGFGPAGGDGREGVAATDSAPRGTDPSALMAALPSTAPRRRPEPLPEIR